MKPTCSDRHIIYTSTAVAHSPRDVFAHICGRARERNAVASIGGVLLFDGQHFAQLLCGPDAAVGALMQRIAHDPRHESLRVLFDGARLAETPPYWRAGYTAPEVLPAFVLRVAGTGADVPHAFQQLLPAADLWPPVPPSR